MKHHLKRALIVSVIGFAIIAGFSISAASSSNSKKCATEQDQKPDGQMTNELKATVISILSNYDPSTLTAEDARAINQAFRDSGVRRGPGQKEAIEAAGFDPEKISALDPPPGRKMKKNKRKDKEE